jgi:hypothetical protein
LHDLPVAGVDVEAYTLTGLYHRPRASATTDEKPCTPDSLPQPPSRGHFAAWKEKGCRGGLAVRPSGYAMGRFVST